MNLLDMWPQLTMLFLLMLSLALNLVRDGQYRTGRNRFGVSLVMTILQVWILWMGDFWQEWHWPQWVMTGLILFGLATAMLKHGERETGQYSFGASAIAVALFC